MTSRNQREGWYSGKMARGVTVNGKPLKHIRGRRYFSLRGGITEVVNKIASGVLENAELLQDFPLEVKGLEKLQEFMDEVAARKDQA